MLLHLKEFLEIVNQPPPYDNDDDQNACEKLLLRIRSTTTADDNTTRNEDNDNTINTISSDLMEELANVSYAYWQVNRYYSTRKEKQLPVGAQQNSALKEIRRQYIGEGRDATSTLTAIQEAMDYRRTYHFNVFRACCGNDKSDIQNEEEEETNLAKKYRAFVLQDLTRQPMIVRGSDHQSRTIVYKSPRRAVPASTAASAASSNSTKSNTHRLDDDEAFLRTQIYTAERAMATNEFNTKNEEERLTVVFNFHDYSRKNSPSTSTVLLLLKVFQRCYPERLGVLMIMYPPWWMRALYTLVSPVLSAATTENIVLLATGTAVTTAFDTIVRGGKNKGDDNNLRDDDDDPKNKKELIKMLVTGTIAEIDYNDYVQQPFYLPYKEIL